MDLTAWPPDLGRYQDHTMHKPASRCVLSLTHLVLSAHQPRKSALSAASSECPKVLKKFCAFSAECIGQFSSVLVSAL